MVGITLSEEEVLGGEEHSVVDSLDPLVWMAARWPPAGTGRDSENPQCTHTCKSLAPVWHKNPVTACTWTCLFIKELFV